MTTESFAQPVAAPRLRAPFEARAARFVRGRESDAPWVRPALLTLLGATALLYLWGLSKSGWANSFYAAAAQAGSENWKAFFFGSSDAANSITVDKTPGALWVMSLSMRLFGVNSWSLLVPEALMGVGTVGLVYLSVRRWYGATAGLLAGTALALTPIAVLMFRFDNPDALLVLLMVGAVYATQRALETASTRWLVGAGVLVGFAFLAKTLQAMLIVPSIGLVYLLFAPTPVRRRLLQLLAGLAALVVSAGWWIAIVELTPASKRPYIGGSQHNSALELALGYNGFGRLNGDETGSVGGGARPGGGGMWGATGWSRMFNPENGGQVAWLIPGALILLAFGLLATLRRPRTDLLRAGLVLWGSWMVVTMLVFSFMKGIYHPYYTVALAPAVAATSAIGGSLAWRSRRNPGAAISLAAALVATVWWAHRLLERSPHFHAWLAPTVLVLGLVGALALLANALIPGPLAAGIAAVAILLGLAGPAAYAMETAKAGHEGSIPSAGPAVSGGHGGPGGFGGGFRFGNRTRNGAQFPSFGGQNGFPGFPGQGLPGQTGTVPGQGGTAPGQTGTVPGAGGGSPGGLLDASKPGETLTQLLKNGAAGFRWVGAAVGSNSASGYQLASGEPVMPVGGFNGSDPSPTLQQFQQYVADGKIHYFLGGGRGGFPGPGFGNNGRWQGTNGGGANGGGSTQGAFGNQMGGSRASSDIASWVAANFTATTVDGVTVYDLTAPTADATGTATGT